MDRGLAENKSKAQALVMSGLVFSDTRRMDKPGAQVKNDIPLDIKGKDHPWVSRGGLKLDHAIGHFSLDLRGAIAADIGASTGGFTEVMLSHGAAHVYAVDVGHGQLAWKLRSDQRVTVLEKTNARYLDRETISNDLDFIGCDASFISLKTVLPAVMDLAAARCVLTALIKPQFEVGRGKVGKGGVVRDPELHNQVCDDIQNWLSGIPDWSVTGIAESPIRGPKGNVEFLIVARKNK